MDEDEIRRFVKCEYARVVNAVALVCDSRAAADDAVEEALARAWLRMRRGDTIDSLVAWVTTVAMNEARGGMRRRRAEDRARDRLADPARSPRSPTPAPAPWHRSYGPRSAGCHGANARSRCCATSSATPRQRS